MSDPVLEAMRAELSRRDSEEDREVLPKSLSAFVRAAWPVLKPDDAYHHNWHIDLICEHLEAVSRDEIHFLQIWVPRASMKSLLVSVMWPAWEWTRDPWLRYWTASYELGLAGRLNGIAQRLIKSRWYQDRWGEKFQFITEGRRYCANDKAGTRMATAPGSTALGEHGHRIIIDDAINAQDADATSRAKLEATNEWYDSSTEGSKADPSKAAEVIIMQRLHERDLAAHAYETNPQDWTILCLPERYEADHPFAFPGDPRKEGELLWPNHRPEAASERQRVKLRHRASGQMQQRPAAREGEMLLRHWWRFYDPRLFTDESNRKRWPRFTLVVQSIDTPQKDKQTNDLIAIQAWAVVGADRYLIDLKKGHLSYSQAKRQTLEQARYVRKLFPKAAHYVLIENAGYGVELITDLKRELTGVQKLQKNDEGDKEVRADAAAADLESGNCFLPGYRTAADESSPMDEARSPADIVDFVEECANFPHAKYDDQVDAWSQAMNWLRARPQRRARTWSSHKIAR